MRSLLRCQWKMKSKRGKEKKETDKKKKGRIKCAVHKINLPRANCQCILRCLINLGKVRTTASKMRPHIHIHNLWYWARPSTNTTLAFLSSDICYVYSFMLGTIFFLLLHIIFFFFSLTARLISSFILFYVFISLFELNISTIIFHYKFFFFVSWLKSKGLPFYF